MYPYCNRLEGIYFQWTELTPNVKRQFRCGDTPYAAALNCQENEQKGVRDAGDRHFGVFVSEQVSVTPGHPFLINTTIPADFLRVLRVVNIPHAIELGPTYTISSCITTLQFGEYVAEVQSRKCIFHVSASNFTGQSDNYADKFLLCSSHYGPQSRAQASVRPPTNKRLPA
ncbi:hypothetical protein BDZ91DRAFT_766618 [Kalaharituber pfeilii]|nr:hypothetical protein BDZ91DRAFT_766618 [Kalaharituber pfeilii]